MEEPKFDPGGFLEFDMAKGAVRARRGGRVVLLPEGVLKSVVQVAMASGQSSDAFRELGEFVGARVVDSLGAHVSDASPEAVLGHLSATLSLLGLGRAQIETWGDAMVVEVVGAPDLGRTEGVIERVIAGVFGALTGTRVECAATGQNRFLVLHPDALAGVRARIADGASLAELIGTLHGGEA